MKEKLKQKYIRFETPVEDLTWDSCFVNSQNSMAVKFLKKWNKNDRHKIVMLKGSGSNFLSRIWQKYNNASILSDTNEMVEILNQKKLNNLVIKNLHNLINNPKSQEIFFHVFNMINNYNNCHLNDQIQVLFTLPCTQTNFDGLLKDLSSRLQSILTFNLDPPNDEMVKAILSDLLSKKQITVNQKIFDYLVLRSARSCKKIEVLVEKIETKVYENRQSVTHSLIKECLSEINNSSSSTL